MNVSYFVLYLKSKLLFPEDDEEEIDVEGETESSDKGDIGDIGDIEGENIEDMGDTIEDTTEYTNEFN